MCDLARVNGVFIATKPNASSFVLCSTLLLQVEVLFSDMHLSELLQNKAKMSGRGHLDWSKLYLFHTAQHELCLMEAALPDGLCQTLLKEQFPASAFSSVM